MDRLQAYSCLDLIEHLINWNGCFGKLQLITTKVGDRVQFSRKVFWENWCEGANSSGGDSYRVSKLRDLDSYLQLETTLSTVSVSSAAKLLILCERTPNHLQLLLKDRLLTVADSRSDREILEVGFDVVRPLGTDDE